MATNVIKFDIITNKRWRRLQEKTISRRFSNEELDNMQNLISNKILPALIRDKLSSPTTPGGHSDVAQRSQKLVKSARIDRSATGKNKRGRDRLVVL